MTGYDEFLAAKLRRVSPAGFDAGGFCLPVAFKGHQSAAVGWACRLGRGAVFFDTGLGKTAVLLAWADIVSRHTTRPVLVLCPLAVGPQTTREAVKFGVPGVRLAESQADVPGPGVYVTNYQKLHRFDPAAFGGVVLDESSILKSYDGRYKQALCGAFRDTPYKLALTATPSPNDHEELGNHAEFLGVCTRQEMLGTYFVHDSGHTSEWRLKGHAEVEFWRWVASWALVARTPADLGFVEPGYDLPPLRIDELRVPSPAQDGRLFALPEATLTGQRQARRKTLEGRCRAAAEIAATFGDEPLVVWCELNDEADLCEKLIPGAVQLSGADSDEVKVERLEGFASGKYRVLVTKPKICGHGLNWQHCARMVFVGLSHSFEQFYQAVRRCHRYGQTRPVEVTVVSSDLESGVVENVRRKEKEHDGLFASAVAHTAAVNRESIGAEAVVARPPEPAGAGSVAGAGWTLVNGDCVEAVAGLGPESVDYSVFSPPFASLYTYSDSPRDMGNCRGEAEFFDHFRHLVPALYRVLKPGRLLSFHCMNLPLTKAHCGVIGVSDFRGDLIRAFQSGGFIFHSEVCVWKDPVTAMQRTKALGLLHKQLKKDSCMSRQGIPDYVVTMRKPGANADPVYHYGDVTEAAAAGETDADRVFPVERWQRYASPVWADIDQTDVLPYAGAREEKDERHVCPLQLGVIDRCLELWSNPGDLVLSPFAGVGSEGYGAVRAGRRFVGVELKRSYFDQAVLNLTRAERSKAQRSLFDGLDPAG